MSWQTVASIDTRYGYTKLQYDDSSTGTSRTARVIFELNAQSTIYVNFKDFTVDGNNLGTILVQGNQTLWSGSLPNGNRSVTYWCYWYDVGTREYSGTGYIPTGVTAPSGVSGTNNTSDGTEGKANSTVSVSSWGAGSSSSWWVVSKINGRGSEWTASNSTGTGLTWTGLSYSTSTSACAITTWYPEAFNNNSLYTFGSAKYIASPSAPVITATGVTSSTSPTCTIKGTCTYKGGEANSNSANTASMSKWRMYYGESGGSTTTVTDTDTSGTHNFSALAKSTFALGKNYTFTVRPTNNFGGYSTNSATIYCPTGVSGSADNSQTTQLTFYASCNYAGDLNAQNAGTIACYQFAYSTNQSTWTTSNVQTSSSYTVTGLTPNTTYYYKITAWNKYGLSQISSVMSVKTAPRYVPVLGSLSTTLLSSGVGFNLIVPMSHPGGTTLDESTIKTLTVYAKNASTDWSQIASATNLSYGANTSHTFSNVHTGNFQYEGDYQIKVVASNGTDSATSSILTIPAPSAVNVTSAGLASGQPTQFSVSATVTGSNIYQWQLHTAGTNTRPLDSTATTNTLASVNYLNYDTAYNVFMRVYNKYGLWRNSSMYNLRTDKRVKWYNVNQGGQKSVTASFVGKGNSASQNISEVYLVVKNALGNLGVGDSLQNKRLSFITQPIFYRPENVAAMTLSNGKTIEYKKDTNGDVYKFGIWNGNTIETTFFDGYSWTVSTYEFGNTALTITALTNTGKGMNSSSAFSTTTCTDIPLWER